ncbi:hepcidin-like [Kryptolebias marmoratus]|uniref:hepcidin-like n=1 Tax=Kryptolebias marmoratus TaxID=37003 RepID=UPI0007F8CC95|nr:hepcidin-like [Kryptolebias marmoratus]
MKSFSVAVAVAVMLTFICLQESSAAPLTEVQENLVSFDTQAAAPVKPHVDLWEKLLSNRQKRSTVYCGRCCDAGVCRKCCYA